MTATITDYVTNNANPITAGWVHTSVGKRSERRDGRRVRGREGRDGKGRDGGKGGRYA